MAGKISLIVQPGDSFFPLVRAIDKAEKSINITVFRPPLPTGETTIGRADDNEIVIAHTKVSRYHARIEVDGGRCTVADIDSANGTFVNGARVIGTMSLVPGDVVGVGQCEEFRFIQV